MLVASVVVAKAVIVEMVPVSPERSPLRVRKAIGVDQPGAARYRAADGEAPGAGCSGEEDAGVGAEGDRAAGNRCRVPEVFSIIPEVTPSV